MKPIVVAIDELKKAMLEIGIAGITIKSFVVFLGSLLLTRLISVGWYWSFFPFLAYTVISVMLMLKRLNLRVAEEYVPELKEQLITAADTVNAENEIVSSLQEDVLKKMRNIRTSYFLSFGKLTRQLLLMTGLSFITIALAAADVRLVDFNQVLEELTNENASAYEIDPALTIFEEGTNVSDILGNKSIAELGQDELKLTISPVMSDVDIRKVSAPEERQFQSSVPHEVGGATDATYEEKIPKGYQKIVRNYYHEITKSEGKS